MITSTCLVAEETENYPCLKESDNGRVVLFVKPNTGTLVNFTGHAACCDTIKTIGCLWALGEYSDSWMESAFHTYDGKITLQNAKE